MILRVKFRDLPLEEVRAHFSEAAKPTAEQWAVYNGQPVTISTPGHKNNNTYFLCDGPLYQNLETGRCVCPHIAEIGD